MSVSSADDAAITIAWDLLRTGQLQEALTACEHALANGATDADLHYIKGESFGRMGRFPDSAEAMKRAIIVEPKHAPAYHGLGTALSQLGHLNEAAQAFHAAIRIEPNQPATWLALGIAAGRLGDIPTALQAFFKAVELAPQFAEAWHGLGVALHRAQRAEEALGALQRAIALRPESGETRASLGTVLEDLGQKTKATAHYEAALRLNPQLEQARFCLAALTGQEAPPTAPAQYVIKHFDDYAAEFEDRLVNQLEYRVPQAMGNAIRNALGIAAANATPGPANLRAGQAPAVHSAHPKDFNNRRVVLDLGCGTGLCGAELQSLASELIGVDLSPMMIEKSRARGIYDQLIFDDLHDMLRSRRADVDVVAAGDVLIYVGAADNLFAASAVALRKGGLLAFSIETIDGADYTLRESRRYAHSMPYLRRCAERFGFDEVSADTLVLRTEGGKGVEGSVVVWSKSE